MEDEQRPSETFGEYLTRERMLRNIHLEEIAAKTRISVKMLEALESDAHELLPPKVYVIGFLHAFARHIGLDENEVVLRYEDYLRGIGGSLGETRGQWQTRRKPVLWVALILMGVALAAALLLLWRPAFHRGPPIPVRKQGEIHGIGNQSHVVLALTPTNMFSSP
jgi:cytoskeleton protein RodZ